VSSAVGNEAAKTVLGFVQDYDLFVVGHAAPEETRIEMVGWLKMKYPKARILALNPPDCECLDGADYNVPQNVPGGVATYSLSSARLTFASGQSCPHYLRSFPVPEWKLTCHTSNASF